MKIIILSLTFFLFTVECFAQWQAVQSLTTNMGTSWTSYNNAKCISSSNGNIYTVYYVSTTANFDVHFRKLSESGSIIGPDIKISNSDSNAKFPSIASQGNYVYISWTESKNGNNEIYFRRSTDGGNNFLPELRLTNNIKNSDYSSIAVDGNNLYIIWMDDRDNNNEIFLKKSTDFGFSWGNDIKLTNNSANSMYPSIAVNGTNIHVVWSDNRDQNTEIYYKVSTDGGINWFNDNRLTYDITNSVIPSIALNENIIYVVWTDERDFVEQIYFKRSTDNGATWSNDIRLTNTNYAASEPNVCVSSNNIHIVWEDTRNLYPNFDIYYKRSTDYGTTWTNEVKINSSIGSSRFPFVTFSNNYIYAIWHNNRTGNWEIYHSFNPIGNLVGIYSNNNFTLENYFLLQNFPNPFNPSTTIKYNILKEGFVKIYVFNNSGKEVMKLVNERKIAGNYEVKLNATNLSSGIYFYRIDLGSFFETKKMILIK